MTSREIIKGYFETGDKPTEQQFAELIDSGFDLHQFTYRDDYPYEAGNIVLSLAVGKWGAYRRTNHDIGATGFPIQNLSYWTKVLEGINIFNVPIIEPEEPAIDSPFAIFNEDKDYITHTSIQLDNPVTITKDTQLIFEERIYNAPGKYKYLWELRAINSPDIITQKQTRDFQYSFPSVGTFKIKLNVWEFGVADPIINETTIVVNESSISSISMTGNVSKSSYGFLGDEFTITVIVNNTGNEVINNITVNCTNYQLGMNMIPTIPPGGSSSIPYNYVVTPADMQAAMLQFIFAAEGTSNSNVTVSTNATVSINNSAQIVGITIPSFITLPKTGYVYSGSNPVLLKIDATFSSNIEDRIADINYIKLQIIGGSGTDITLTNLSESINANKLVKNQSITLFTDSINYKLKLKYRDAYTGPVDVVSSEEDFYSQKEIGFHSSMVPVLITPITSGEVTTYKVEVHLNKVMITSHAILTNTYVIEEKITDGEYAEVTEYTKTTHGTGANQYTKITFNTTLVDDSAPTVYSFKITEDLGEASIINQGDETMTSTAEATYNYTLEAKPLIGWVKKSDSDLQGLMLEDVFDDAFFSDSSKYSILDVANPNSPFMNWVAFVSDPMEDKGWPFVAFPKDQYPNAFTHYNDGTGTQPMATWYYVKNPLMINGNEYIFYTTNQNSLVIGDDLQLGSATVAQLSITFSKI